MPNRKANETMEPTNSVGHLALRPQSVPKVFGARTCLFPDGPPERQAHRVRRLVKLTGPANFADSPSPAIANPPLDT